MPKTTIAAATKGGRSSTAVCRPNKHYDKAKELSRHIATIGWLMSHTDTEDLEIDQKFAAQLRSIGWWLEAMSEELSTEVYLSHLAVKAEVEGAR